MRDAFHEELDAINETLADLSKRVQKAMELATHALLTADLAVAEQVIAEDHQIDEIQHALDAQTIDLMAAKELAAGFCQANIIKYGSRYGDKDGRNKRDLLKVIHYAMLLLHFDGHYTRKDNGLSEFR